MADDRVFAKCAWRLIPLIVAAHFVSYIDRSNVAYAALTMNQDLGFSPSVFGFGAGILFVTYALFQMPGNIVLHRVGARRWMFCLLAVWGVISASSALIRGPASFYALRAVLGAAEAGFVPGMLLYLSYWFPQAYIGRFTALFMTAPVASLAVGGPLASLILGLEGVLGVRGWQWLFLIEGTPAVIIAFAILRFLPDRPGDAAWLTSNEKKTIGSLFATEDGGKNRELLPALFDPRVLALGVANFFQQAAATGIAIWLPLFVQAMGFSAVATGFVAAVPYTCAVVAMVLWGHSSDVRRERIWHSALPALLGAAGFSAAALMYDYRLVLVALIIAEIGIPPTIATLYSLPSSFLRGPAAAGGIAMFIMIGSFGSFAGPYLIGVLRQQTGSYAPGMALMAGALLLAAFIILAMGHAVAPRLMLRTNAKVS